MGKTNFDQLQFNSMIDASGITIAQIKQVTVTLTSAQILALFTTPITLILAPGAGLVIDIVSVVASLTAGVAYTGANNLEIRYTGAAGVKATADIVAAFINSATSRVDLVGGVIADTDVTTGVNSPIVIAVPVANPAAGTGTIKLTITYTVMPQ